MSNEHLAIRTVEAPVEPKVVSQNLEPLPDASHDLELLAAHVAQYQDTQLLLRIAGILSEETSVMPQVRTLDAGGLELTSTTLPRPEVWRLDGQTITIQQQDGEGQYRSLDRSVLFPILTAINLLQMLHHQERGREESLLATFREWVRKKLRLPDEPLAINPQ